MSQRGLIASFKMVLRYSELLARIARQVEEVDKAQAVTLSLRVSHIGVAFHSRESEQKAHAPHLK